MSRKTKTYKMKRELWKDYFMLHVSPTQASMQKHIHRVYTDLGFDLPDVKYTYGMVQPIRRLSGNGEYAHMFLNEQHIDVGVVAHECVHVAMAHERFVLQFEMNYGDECEDDEERLAYFFTSCVRGVYDILLTHNHLPKDTTKWIS